MVLLIELICLGIFAGVIAGLLGVGGGLVIVPVMFTVLQPIIPLDVLMHVCIGTSLACIILTSLSSIRAHYKRGAVNLSVVQQFAPGLVIGALIAAAVASQLSQHYLKTIFGCFEILVSIRMLWHSAVPQRRWPHLWITRLVAVVIGFVSGLVGIGGGTLSVPYLSYCGMEMKKAIATSAACGLPIAVAGSIGYFATGFMQTQTLPAYSLGYVYLPALFAISSASVLTAPLGVALAHRLPATTLKRCFAIFLAVMGCYLLFFK